MAPRTKMTAEEVAAERAEHEAKNPPVVLRQLTQAEVEAYNAHKSLMFKRGRV